MRPIRKMPLSQHRIALSGTFAALCLIAGSPVRAAAPPTQAVEQYAQMCATQAINMPTPYGEADLKGNPKLTDYCKCFGTKFAERAMATAHDSKTQSLKEVSAQERAMRNACRKQFDLPQLKF